MLNTNTSLPTGTGVSYQLSFGSEIERCASRAQYENVCNSPKVTEVKQQVVELMAEADFAADAELKKSLLNKVDELKRSLPMFMYMANFRGTQRRNEDAVLNGLVFIDYDHIDDPQATLQQLFTEWGGKHEFCQFFGILLIKYSIRGHGFHVVAKAQPEEGGIEENQLWFDRNVFHLSHDEQCKDPARGTFATPMADHEWLSDELFTYQNPAFEEQCSAPRQTPSSSASSTTALRVNGDSQPSASQPPVFDGSVVELIQAVENRALRNTTLGNAPGNHNNTLYRTALYMRAYQDDEQWLMANLPHYNQSDAEFRHTVHSACQAQLPRGAKTQVQEAIREVTRQQRNSALAESNDLCPQLPTSLPPLFAHLSKNVPDYIKPSVIVAAMPALGAHCGKVRLRYINNTPHYTALMSVTIAGSATGKSAQNAVVDYIMADILEKDMEARGKIAQWKQCNEGKQTKDREPKPRVPIRYLPANTTTASFWEAIANANENSDEFGEFLFTRSDEIEALTRISNGSIRKTISCELSELIQFNYDSAKSGQHRVSLEAVNAFVPMKFNFVTACTPHRAVQFFKGSSVTDGCLSRLLIATILPPDTDEMPVYGSYDDAWQAELKPYIDHLNAASGEIRSDEVDDLIRSIMKEQKEQAALASSEMMDSILRREVKTAHRIAMLLYIAQDRRWDDRSSAFIRWIVSYGIWIKMRIFGNQGEKEIQREQAAIQPAHTTNLLDLLPDTFTRQQAINVRLSIGRDGNVKHMLQNWKRRGYIEPTDANTFRKIRK